MKKVREKLSQRWLNAARLEPHDNGLKMMLNDTVVPLECTDSIVKLAANADRLLDNELLEPSTVTAITKAVLDQMAVWYYG